ncbi:hypothetical protein [Brachybacterium sp. GPGPB12]|uniref:hypothetical protein n=1 Tax=Brachybacterium sp. GPGPB12 TaxID=3023517 RepID=UPI0031345DA4
MPSGARRGRYGHGSESLDSPYGLQIAAHEARHQVQYEMIRRTEADPWDWVTGDDNSEEYAEVERAYGFTRGEIEQWRHEFRPWNYEFPPIGDPSTPEYQEQMQDYLDQEVEVNAREREDEFADEFSFEDLQQARRDAGVPVSQGERHHPTSPAGGRAPHRGGDAQWWRRAPGQHLPGG